MVRKPISKPRQVVPKHWLDGDLFKTYLANTLFLMFPDSEDYFIRTVRSFLPSISDEKLKRDTISFMGQESQHRNIHIQTWDILESQGFEIQTFIKIFRFLSFNILEKAFSDKMNLSIVSGLEHYMSILAELILENDLLKNSDPTMKEIFEWHCAEELEHKHVAFDILRETHNDYLLRISGYLIASGLLLGYTIPGILYLAVQGDISQWDRFLREARDLLFTREKTFLKGLGKFLSFFDYDFHPNQKETNELSRTVISKMEFEPILNKESANKEIDNTKRIQNFH